MTLTWLALDGVGHPADAPPGSPWETELPTLRPFIQAGQSLDATLSVDGLPQSATGQATWLTGENAAALMGHHYGPRPGPTLTRALHRALPARLAETGRRTRLLNHYPPRYFERTRAPHGCFPLSVLLAGGALNPPGEPVLMPTFGLNFEAPYGTGQNLDDTRRLGERIARTRERADLTLLDLWFSDHLGHQGRPDFSSDLHGAARAYLRHLDALIEGITHAGGAVIVTSDHGNFENLGVKTHTLARVPFAASGVTLPRSRTIQEGGRAILGLFGLAPDSTKDGTL